MFGRFWSRRSAVYFDNPNPSPQRHSLVQRLALQAKQNQPVQALGFNQGQSITPITNLCHEKGSYRLKLDLLRTGQYPLAYPLAIVYAKDNDRPAIGPKFAELLKTREGQNLLSQTGLVTLSD
jgi:hypothetical protein